MRLRLPNLLLLQLKLLLLLLLNMADYLSLEGVVEPKAAQKILVKLNRSRCSIVWV